MKYNILKYFDNYKNHKLVYSKQFDDFDPYGEYGLKTEHIYKCEKCSLKIYHIESEKCGFASSIMVDCNKEKIFTQINDEMCNYILSCEEMIIKNIIE